MKVFNTGIIVGRFQHIHNGHEKIINIGRSLCETLLIFVGSAGEKTTSRNPYDYEYRDSLPKTAVGKIAYRELGSKK